MIKAVFMDYTGTIIMEDGSAMREFVARIIKNSRFETPQEFQSVWSRNWKELEAQSYRETYIRAEGIADMALQRLEKEYGLQDDLAELRTLVLQFWGSAPVFPDAARFLAQCPAPVYVLTNNSVKFVQQVMEQNDLHPAGIISADEVLAYKPHRELFDHALQIAGCTEKEVIHIGDSVLSDVKGAENAGIRALLIDRNGSVPEEGVEVIRNLTEALPLLEAERKD